MGWLSFLDFLAEPAFIDRRRLPIRLSAKLIGWIALAVSLLLLGLLLAAVGSVIDLRSHPTHFAAAIVGFLLIAISQVIAVVGAWKMTQGHHNGRRLVAQALILSVIGSLIFNIGRSNLSQFVIQFIGRAVLYLLVVISSFPDEAMSTTGEAAPVPPPS